jgi:hypothetical protein
LLLSFLTPTAFSQPGIHSFKKLREGGTMPEKILSARSLVLYEPNMTDKELDLIHQNFNRTGIDAVVYYEIDRIFSGFDVRNAYLDYFLKREIANFIIVLKDTSRFDIYLTKFTGTEQMIDTSKNAWHTSNKVLKSALDEVYRNALTGRKRENLLLSEVPEKNLAVPVIKGRRIEAWAYDLKVDNLAVPRFNDPKMDAELEQIMKQHYPLKYGIVDPSVPEEDLRKQGYFYILRYVNSRCIIARELMGYDVSKGETAFVSVTYPNGEVVTKNIPGDKEIYKFYPKKIYDGTVYLGTKWEADTTWQQALINHLKTFKAELRIN